ncbi:MULTISPECIES: hypothetical protein [Chelativorans]|uniref:Uncharacterized protein n=1 Tax=Chelativorans sp. (strain BNC1) TaxID=266779 RepID=Q11LW2_CHESB|nr:MULTISPECIES: hypothetical protein [Chelativorans]
MLKRISAVTLASAIWVGAFENPAHSDPIEEAAFMAIAAGVCGAVVPDAVFLPRVKDVAVQNGVNISEALSLIRAQAELVALQLIEAEAGDEFCQHVQNISFE